MFNKKLKRTAVLPLFANLPTCLIGIEACGGAHYWAREIAKLDAGHTLRLLSPRHVKPFVLNNKTDAADARAICEVVGRPSTRFVNIKTVEQQDMTAWHRIRERKVKERTALVNQIRALLMEQGVVIPKGITHVRKLLPGIIEELENGLSWQARDYLSELYTELVDVDAAVDRSCWASANEATVVFGDCLFKERALLLVMLCCGQNLKSPAICGCKSFPSGGEGRLPPWRLPTKRQERSVCF